MLFIFRSRFSFLFFFALFISPYFSSFVPAVSRDVHTLNNVGKPRGAPMSILESETPVNALRVMNMGSRCRL